MRKGEKRYGCGNDVSGGRPDVHSEVSVTCYLSRLGNEAQLLRAGKIIDECSVVGSALQCVLRLIVEEPPMRDPTRIQDLNGKEWWSALIHGQECGERPNVEVVAPATGSAASIQGKGF